MNIYVFVCPACKQETKSLDKGAVIRCGNGQKGTTFNHKPTTLVFSYSYQRTR